MTAPAGPPAVGAVVVNYNARRYLLECLRSLRSAGVEEIVVADNASVDGSEGAVVEADRGVDYHQTGANLGYGTGCNRGVERLDPQLPYVLCLNPDARLQPGALEAMLAVMDDRPDVGIVGPRIENPDGTLYPSARTFPALVDAVGHAFLGMVLPRNRFTRRYRMLDWDHAAAADVDWVSGACFLVRRKAWDAVGGFDEAYFMYAEDVDLCWRAQRAGWKVAYEPAAAAVHEQGVSTDRHPYRMILEHHRAAALRRPEQPGVERALLPLMAVGLVVRIPLAWLHRLVEGAVARERDRPSTRVDALWDEPLRARRSRAASTGGGRTARGSRPLGWYAAITLVIVLGVAGIVSSRAERRAELASGGSLVPPAPNRDHWHAAYGIYLCDTFAPTITDERDPKGIHTHADGVIHIHPFVRSAAGNNATLGLYADAVGMTLTDDEIKLPGGKAYREGKEKCGDAEAIVQVRVDNGPVITENIRDIKYTDRQLLTIACSPKGAELPEPPSKGQLDNLTDVPPEQQQQQIPIPGGPTDPNAPADRAPADPAATTVPAPPDTGGPTTSTP